MKARRGVAAILIGCVVVAAGCSSADDTADTAEPIASSATTATVATATEPPATTDSSLPADTTEAEAPAAPLAINDLPPLVVEPTDSAWGELELVGEFAAIGLPSIVPGSRSMILIEQRGQVEEGCEGGIEPLGRLISFDLDTGASTTLIPELELTDTRFVLGPAGRFALVAGCDANAWLGAVGSLAADGTVVDIVELDSDSEDRIWGGGNAGVSITWGSGGDMLFFDSIRVDAGTGQRLDPIDPDSRTRVHAELADGTRLVAAPSGELNEFFWVDNGSGRLEELTATPATFTAQSVYPALRVEIDAAGERAYAVFEDWETSTIHTAVIGGDDVRQVAGGAVPSPSGRSLLVRTGSEGERSEWSVVDLQSGTSKAVPLPEAGAESWFYVEWGGSDDELIISMASASAEPLPPIDVWLLTAS